MSRYDYSNAMSHHAAVLELRAYEHVSRTLKDARREMREKPAALADAAITSTLNRLIDEVDKQIKFAALAVPKAKRAADQEADALNHDRATLHDILERTK